MKETNCRYFVKYLQFLICFYYSYSIIVLIFWRDWCMDIYAAHIRDDGKIQSVKDHLEGTAKLASNFADSFNNGE